MPKGVYVRRTNPIANLTKRGHRKPRPWQERFWGKVDKTDKCWIWIGGKAKGYGKIRLGPEDGNRLVAAHKASFEIRSGPIPDGMHVLHNCDNRACVNPDHLYLGSELDNARDRVQRGLQVHGSRHPFSKLTDEQVIEIRSLGEVASPGKLAKRYGVSYFTIRRVLNGETYRSPSS
jgi:hypothetical protein